ncbi:hypothetical protein [Sphingomonas sp.]
MANIKKLSGTWYDGAGYQSDLHHPTLEIEIRDGKAFDPIYGLPLKLTAEKEFQCWGDAYFVPDEGELARVGLA